MIVVLAAFVTLALAVGIVGVAGVAVVLCVVVAIFLVGVFRKLIVTAVALAKCLCDGEFVLVFVAGFVSSLIEMTAVAGAVLVVRSCSMIEEALVDVHVAFVGGAVAELLLLEEWCVVELFELEHSAVELVKDSAGEPSGLEHLVVEPSELA